MTRTRIGRLAIPIVLAIMVIAFLSPTVMADGDMSQYQSGVVPISSAVENNAGSYDFVYGTAFFITDEYLLTTYDCVKSLYEGKGQLEIVYGAGDAKTAAIAEVDTRKNLALIQISHQTQRTPLKVNLKTAPSPGQDDVYIVGIAEVSFGNVRSMSESITVNKDSVTRSFMQSDGGMTTYQLGSEVSVARDGSPLLNANGEVVGIASARASSQAGYGCAVSINAAEEIMARRNISQGVNVNVGLVIGIAVAVIVVAGVVILLIILRKKKLDAKMIEDQKKAAAQPKPSVAKPRTPILCCMTGEHSGLKMNVRDQQIYFGRNIGTCRVVFKDGTPGISSIHCVLSFDSIKNEFILIDQKSTHGTFLASGQQLTPSMPYSLTVKDAFYLGEKDNMFFVDFQE